MREGIKSAIILLISLPAASCTEINALFEEEPKTCGQACEDTYISCLESAFVVDTEVATERGPYKPWEYPPRQTTTTTTSRRVPSKAKEERCRLEFERCQQACSAPPPVQAEGDD